MRAAKLFLALCFLFIIGAGLVSAESNPSEMNHSPLSTSAVAAVLTVDNDGDSGVYLPGATCITGIPNDCSLRQAILVANATSGSDIIRFDLSLYPNGMTIRPSSQLPDITRPVELDGVTATGGNCPTTNDPANLPVTLDGRNLSGTQKGLVLGYYEDSSNPFNNTNSNGSIVRGLNVINFPGTGIYIDRTDDHTIVCNHIGLADGTTTAGNQYGILVHTNTADNNTIGGPNVGDRNVISGNAVHGILNGGDITLIEGNYIGLDKTGTLARGNGENGIINSGNFTIIRSNVIADSSGGNGISINTNGTQILDNLIGTDATGTLARGNYGNGIEVNGNNAIIQGNVIADNNIYGIALIGDNHEIQGNKIGTSADGNSDLGNVYAGILLLGDNTTIGGTTLPADRNIISGNGGGGIWLVGSNSLVQGNYIGTAANGTTPLGNETSGILLDGAVDNRIGQAGAENVIAYNGLNGITVKNTGSVTSARNDLRDNVIDSNGGLGIDLLGSGEAVGEVSPNDNSDADSGPNGLQNHMTLISAEPNGRVQGTLTGPDGLYTVSIYQRDTCDASGFGEGGSNRIRLIPAVNVSGGVYNYDEVLSPAPPLGSYLVTLVTDVNGNTSEFGNCRQVADVDFVIDSTTDFGDQTPGDGLCESVGIGVCTLRAAIEEVNALGGGPYTFAFNFGALNLVRTIEPNSALPTITTPVILDASTMPGATCPVGSTAANHRLVIDGTNAPGDGLVLSSSASGSTIRGLEIRNFSGDGIEVNGDTNVIACNTFDNNFQGVNVTGNDNQIGGTARSERNVIINSGRWGVRLGNTATLNKVQGNYIGVAGDGTTAAGNADSGIYLSGGGSNRIGGSVGFAANVIANNGLHGIEIDAGDGGNQVWGNLIGLDASGTVAAGNTGSGVYINSANSNEIGGDSDTKRNVIAANGANGIFINSNSNIVRRNYIGTDINGLTDLGNTSMGIRLVDGDTNVIGGDTAVDGNLISGNNDSGVYVAGSAVGTSIRFNDIGVTAGGTALGNTLNGVHLTGQVSQATVQNNTIAYNGKDGIAVFETVILSNFSRNAIYDNGELGIDLNNDDVVNTNDTNDGDTGGNGLMNFPVILGADAGSNTVTFLLNSLAPRDYRIHFYRNRTCDASGHGEGEQYLGSFDVSTISGNTFAQDSAVMTFNFNAGDKITATATPLTSPITDGTSEFSACFTATGVPTTTPTAPTTWGNQNVGFIINTTAGMQPVIDRVEAAWAQNAWANCPTCTPDMMHLVPFRDSAIYLGGTDNASQFGNWLGTLEAGGGTGCSDGTFDALRTFGTNLAGDSAPVSDALVFSDSVPANNRRAFGYLLDRMISRGISVHNMGPTLCNDGPLPEATMDYLSVLSGGTFHLPESLTAYPTDAQMAMNLAMAPDIITTIRGELNNTSATFPLELDSSVTTLGIDYQVYCLTCTFKTDPDISDIFMTSTDITVELLDPSGAVVNASMNGYQAFSTSTRMMQMLFGTLNSADAGTWQVRVSGNGQYMVNVFADSGLHMTSVGQHVARANQPFDVSALMAADAGGACSECVPASVTMQLVGLDNSNSVPVSAVISDPATATYKGSVTVPAPGLYRLAVAGVLEDGTQFMRVDPTPIRVRAHGVSSSGSASVTPGTMRTISFELTNDGTAGSSAPTTFDLELFSELGWTAATAIPQSVTLDVGESVVYMVETVVPTTAEIGLVEESVFVAVPQNDLSAAVSVVVETAVIDQFTIYLPAIVR